MARLYQPSSGCLPAPSLQARRQAASTATIPFALLPAREPSVGGRLNQIIASDMALCFLGPLFLAPSSVRTKRKEGRGLHTASAKCVHTGARKEAADKSKKAARVLTGLIDCANTGLSRATQFSRLPLERSPAHRVRSGQIGRHGTDWESRQKEDFCSQNLPPAITYSTPRNW